MMDIKNNNKLFTTDTKKKYHRTSPRLKKLHASVVPFHVSVKCDTLCEELGYLRISERKVIPTVPNRNARNYVVSRRNAWRFRTKTTKVQEDLLFSRRSTAYEKNITSVTDYIRRYAHSLHWEDNWASQLSVKYVELDWHSKEYHDVEKLFNCAKKRCFRVTKIERIQHPYLLAAFLMRKEELERRNGYHEVVSLFHGTKKKPVMSICTNKQNLCGQKFGNNFRYGINLNYPISYHDCTQGKRIALLVHILIGNKNHEILSNVPNTPEKSNIAKFRNNEFYPIYRITYCHDNPRKANDKKKKKKYKQIVSGDHIEYDDHCNSFYRNDYRFFYHHDTFYNDNTFSDDNTVYDDNDDNDDDCELD